MAYIGVTVTWTMMEENSPSSPGPQRYYFRWQDLRGLEQQQQQQQQQQQHQQQEEEEEEEEEETSRGYLMNDGHRCRDFDSPAETMT